jgi:hypothetical protein
VTTTDLTPRPILDCAHKMGAEVFACATSRGQTYVAARWRKDYVVWAWDGLGFVSGQYCPTEPEALDRLRARLEPVSTALAWADLSPAAKQAACGIVCTAVEGGVNYWAAVEHYRWRHFNADGTDTDPEGRIMFSEDTHAILRDTEDEDGEPMRLDGPAIVRGLAKLADGSVRGCSPSSEPSWARALQMVLAGEDPDLDAGDADCIAQAALLGEIVYG